MGVMECSRRGCDNCMCDYYSPDHGYICNECKEEFIELAMSVSIDGFMMTPKNTVNNEGLKNAAEAYFNTVFTNRDTYAS